MEGHGFAEIILGIPLTRRLRNFRDLFPSVPVKGVTLENINYPGTGNTTHGLPVGCDGQEIPVQGHRPTKGIAGSKVGRGQPGGLSPVFNAAGLALVNMNRPGIDKGSVTQFRAHHQSVSADVHIRPI